MSEGETQPARVRFRQPIRVVPLEGPPRVVRSHTIDLSRQGLFVQAGQPLPLGTKVALSLEAGGKALPFAEAQVVRAPPVRASGFGVRFDRFLHPRGRELVDYLVDNLDRGRPLVSAPRPRRWRRSLVLAAALLGLAGAFSLGGLFLLKAMVAADVDRAGAGDSSPGLVAVAPADRSVTPGETTGLPELAVKPMLGPPAPGETRGEIVLPSGAASALAWAAVDRELRLSVVLSGGRFDRTFLLADPPRVVFDLEGAEPDRSYGIDPKGPFLKRVRVGGQRGTTRVVVDLVRWPADSTEDGEAVILSF